MCPFYCKVLGCIVLYFIVIYCTIGCNSGWDTCQQSSDSFAFVNQALCSMECLYMTVVELVAHNTMASRDVSEGNFLP